MKDLPAAPRSEASGQTTVDGLADRGPRGSEPPDPAAPGVVGWSHGRVDAPSLEAALSWLGFAPNAPLPRRAVPWREEAARAPGTAVGAAEAYVCGPPQMADETAMALRRMGVRTHSEQWW